MIGSDDHHSAPLLCLYDQQTLHIAIYKEMFGWHSLIKRSHSPSLYLFLHCEKKSQPSGDWNPKQCAVYRYVPWKPHTNRDRTFLCILPYLNIWLLVVVEGLFSIMNSCMGTNLNGLCLWLTSMYPPWLCH